MEDKKERLTKAQLIQKINDERQTFQMAREHQQQETDKAIAAVRRVADQVIARFVRSFGQKKDGEYVLDIQVPDCPDGHFWGTKIEIVDESTWRLHCKLYEIPAFEGRKEPESVKQLHEKTEEGVNP